MAAHGAALLDLAPKLYADLHASLNRTVVPTGRASPTHCWRHLADTDDMARGQITAPWRAFSQMLYSGAMTRLQTEQIYGCMASGLAPHATDPAGRTSTAGDGGKGAQQMRLLTLGLAGWNSTVAPHVSYGLAYGLMQHDMTERFLLLLYATSAHAYTRGTWTTPESADVADRDTPSGAYDVVSVNALPVCLKWMLCFEEVESRTLWLAKATPREWLSGGAAPILAQRMSTRYGRVSLRMHATSDADGTYRVWANVSLSPSFATTSRPPGGVRLRLRVPLAFASRLSAVSVGGRAWSAFDAAEETVDVAASSLTPDMIANGLTRVVGIYK